MQFLARVTNTVTHGVNNMLITHEVFRPQTSMLESVRISGGSRQLGTRVHGCGLDSWVLLDLISDDALRPSSEREPTTAHEDEPIGNPWEDW